ncbi:hypothetical protein ACFU7T_32725 [Streptomyces sp. NPDC057555]|uniref:hypothetical protein n=1 Tax=Streptomyces sp. NPDC057555 TaxID=3346166 RepID=UPI0036C83C2D
MTPYVGADGRRHSDTHPDGTLVDAGAMDLARHAADHLRQPAALAPTSGCAKPDQGGPQRIIRTYSADGLHEALEHVEVIDTTAHPSTIKQTQDAVSLLTPSATMLDQQESNDHVRLGDSF